MQTQLILRSVTMALLVLFALVAVPGMTPASAQGVGTTRVSIPTGNTLNSGALDVRGSHAARDSERGPLFHPAGAPPSKPAAEAWSALRMGVDWDVYSLIIR